MPVRSHRPHSAIAGAVALTVALAAPAAPALASLDDNLVEKTNTTYRLQPDERLVHVDSTVTLSNKAKPTTRRGPCKNGKGTCKITTRYYFDGWGRFWTPIGAENVQVGGPKVTPLPATEVGGGLAYHVSFPKLWNKKGAKQKVTMAFDIPSGTVETTDRPERIEAAYAFFCWWGMAGDTGTTRAMLPAGWEVVTDGDVVVETRPDATVVTAVSKNDPVNFIECMEAFDPEGFERTYVTGDTGQSLVVVEAWPGHQEWADDVAGVAGSVLTTLESTMGTPMPYGELRIRETANQAREYTWADVRPKGGIIGMSEHVAAVDYVPSRLARAWVDPDHFSDTWLGEGIALWLAAQATEGGICAEPEDYPGATAPDLDDWLPEDADAALRAWQEETACHIVDTGAEVIGPEVMVELVRDLIAAPVPVGTGHWLAAVSRELPEGLDRVVAALDEAGADH